MLFSQLVSFRKELFFEGAVQADWFYRPDKADVVARNFVFHGPETHAVSASEVGGGHLIDTASFVRLIAEKLNDAENELNPLTLAIAGYGTGKSHLAVALSELLSGRDFAPDTFDVILENISRSDRRIAEAVKPLLQKPNLVLTLNGMKDFNLHYELLRTAQKALSLYKQPESIIRSLSRAHETAGLFLSRNFDVFAAAFEQAAASLSINQRGVELKRYLTSALITDECAFACINAVYSQINSHEIRWDEGVSATQILETLLHECCGNKGQFDHIIILFDEFGRYLEYASANPTKAGDSALQQIFEAVQNAEGDIQFIGFIQADIKAYLQRVDKAANISRYINRYDASEKVYLSSNLETIFANLLQHPQPDAYRQYILSYFDRAESDISALYSDMSRFLPLKGIWKEYNNFNRILVRDLYPLTPVATYLLTNLTDWLQNRSSLTLLSDLIARMGLIDIPENGSIPLITPVQLLKGTFFAELLSAEEQGRQKSQICILYDAILRRLSNKLNEHEQDVLLANVILRVCRFRTQTRMDAVRCLSICAGLDTDTVNDTLRVLEEEFAVLEFDERVGCFDFIADAVGANDFRNYMRRMRSETIFTPEVLSQNEAVKGAAAIADPIETDFGDAHGIQTSEWSFVQMLLPVRHLTGSVFETYVDQWKGSSTPDAQKGLLIWTYINRDTEDKQLTVLQNNIERYCKGKPIVVFALNDTDDNLRNAVIDLLAYGKVDAAGQAKYARFFDEGLKKAQKSLESQFDICKKARLLISGDGITVLTDRLPRYLSSVFESIYVRAIPFDFDGFKGKTLAKPRKLFCQMSRWMMNGDMIQSLKVQPIELKDRFTSVLMSGIHSWRSFNDEYRAIPPQEERTYAVYKALESNFKKNESLDFGAILLKLYAPPFGLNDYSAVLLLELLALNLAYCSRLMVGDEKLNCANWVERTITEKKIDLKIFSATKLILVNVEQSTTRYVLLFKRIEDNRDIEQVESLNVELEALQKQDELPEALEAQFKLARLKLEAGMRACRNYQEDIGKLWDQLQNAKERDNAYNAMIVLKKSRAILPTAVDPDGGYVYTSAQMRRYQELTVRSERFVDDILSTWLTKQRCLNVADMSVYGRRMNDVIQILTDTGYDAEARQAIDIRDRELASKELIQRRDTLYTHGTECCKHWRVSTDTPLVVLEEYQREGEAIVNEIDAFSQREMTDNLASMRDKLNDTLAKVRNEITTKRSEMDQIWNDLYDINTYEDVRRLSERISVILRNGVSDNDREDFERADHFLEAFLQDAAPLRIPSRDRAKIEVCYNTLRTKYNTDDTEVDLLPVLVCMYEAQKRSLDDSEQRWMQALRAIEPSSSTEVQLDAWLRKAAEIPEYLSESSVEEIRKMTEVIEHALQDRRIDQIIMLYRRLSEDEKRLLLQRLEAEY